MNGGLRRFTRVVTNLIKMAGLVVGLGAPHGGLSSHPQAVVLGFAAFLIAGGEVSERMIIGLANRFFGSTAPPFHAEPPPKQETS